jgi:hypothetical protein
MRWDVATRDGWVLNGYSYPKPTVLQGCGKPRVVPQNLRPKPGRILVYPALGWVGRGSLLRGGADFSRLGNGPVQRAIIQTVLFTAASLEAAMRFP